VTDGEHDPYAAVATALVPTVLEGASVLAVLPAWDDQDSHLHLQAVRSALDTTRVVVHRTMLPPLAAAWLVDLLARLAADHRLVTADLVRALSELEARCAGAAWLGSVTKLQHPSPTLAMHARSWVRGAGFAAVVDHDPKVVPLRRGDDGMPLPAAPDEGWEIAVAIGDGDLARVERSLAGHRNGTAVSKLPLGDVSRRWWGTDKLIELAFRPQVTDVLVERLVTTRPASRCHWCDQPVVSAVCPFCRMRQPSPTADPLGGRA
jgi:hypothetical protein